MPLSLAQLSARCGGTIVGKGDVLITGVASLQKAGRGQLAFFAGADKCALAATGASAVLLQNEQGESAPVPAGAAKWLVEGEPRRYFACAIDALHPPQEVPAGISPAASIAESACLADDVAVAATAVIGARAKIGSGSVIHAGVIIGDGVVVGDHCTLYPRVVLYSRTVLGKNCILHAGSVIGADGFGYAGGSSGSVKIRQLGGVKIGDCVEIGANSAIDCGSLDDTVIGNGVKIDNLVQIGHNVIIGDGTVICGGAGIAGSSKIGSDCIIGGAAGIADHLKIGDDVKIAGASSVTRDIKSGETVSSVMPALPIRRWRRLIAGLRRQWTR